MELAVVSEELEDKGNKILIDAHLQRKCKPKGYVPSRQTHCNSRGKDSKETTFIQGSLS